MAFNAFNMAFNAGRPDLREGRFSGDRFSIKRGEGALRAP